MEFEFFLNILGEDFQMSKELKNAKKIDFFKILKCTSTLKRKSEHRSNENKIQN